MDIAAKYFDDFYSHITIYYCQAKATWDEEHITMQLGLEMYRRYRKRDDPNRPELTGAPLPNNARSIFTHHYDINIMSKIEL